jgi:hypothetical protein
MTFMLIDLKKSLSEVSPEFEGKSYAEILTIVKGGSYFTQGPLISNNMDLSEAKNMVDAYRALSEGGCVSCIGLRQVPSSDIPNESYQYCEYHDLKSQDDGSESAGKSSLVSKHWDKPCGLYDPKIKVSLDSIVRDIQRKLA